MGKTTKLELEEIGNLLKELVDLRRSCSTEPSLKKKFDILQQTCIQKLDFLVDARTRKYKKFANYEDLKQDGRLAMVLGLKSYDPAKGDFLWWLNKYVKTRISREANRHSTIKIPIKHAKKMQPYKISQIPVIIDNDLNPQECAELNQDQIMVRAAVSALPEKQRNVIQFYFSLNSQSDNDTIQGICDKFDLERVDCIRLLKEAKKNLKEQLIELY